MKYAKEPIVAKNLLVASRNELSAFKQEIGQSTDSFNKFLIIIDSKTTTLINDVDKVIGDFEAKSLP